MLPTIKDKIRELLKNKTVTERIEILESIGKEYRQKNSQRINKVYLTGKVDADRPDLIEMREN